MSSKGTRNAGKLIKPMLLFLRVGLLLFTVCVCEIIHSTIFLSNEVFEFEEKKKKHLCKCSRLALCTRMTVDTDTILSSCTTHRWKHLYKTQERVSVHI